MSKIIPSHGTPTGSVFGLIGDLIGTDEGKPYVKYEYDTLNIGWGAPRPPQPAPVVTPTPSLTPYPPQAFYCISLQATGSSKCGNECRLEWVTDNDALIAYEISWTRPATALDPVFIMGNNTTSSLMNYSTSYSGFFSPSPTPSGKYWMAFTRPRELLDTAKIKISILTGDGVIRSARLISYTFGLNTEATLKVHNIHGNYVCHTRNLSGLLNNGTGGIISGVLSDPQQTLSVSGKSAPSVELLEIIGYTDNLYFVPRNVQDCTGPTPTPTPTLTGTLPPTPTPTLTPTITYTGPEPSGTPTPTPTRSSEPTPTPTPTLTPTLTRIGAISVYIDYDEYGRAQASWLNIDGILVEGSLLTGIPFTTAFSQVIGVNSLKVIYGTNVRYAQIGSSDPRTQGYQIDAKTDSTGDYNFDYVDSYGVTRNASGKSSANTQVYAVACGIAIASVSRGSATMTARYC